MWWSLSAYKKLFSREVSEYTRFNFTDKILCRIKYVVTLTYILCHYTCKFIQTLLFETNLFFWKNFQVTQSGPFFSVFDSMGTLKAALHRHSSCLVIRKRTNEPEVWTADRHDKVVTCGFSRLFAHARITLHSREFLRSAPISHSNLFTLLLPRRKSISVISASGTRRSARWFFLQTRERERERKVSTF